MNMYIYAALLVAQCALRVWDVLTCACMCAYTPTAPEDMELFYQKLGAAAQQSQGAGATIAVADLLAVVANKPGEEGAAGGAAKDPVAAKVAAAAAAGTGVNQEVVAIHTK